MRDADKQARSEARDAVRAAGDGKSRDELRALLERAFDERDLTMEPLMLERQVEMILAARQPFGRTPFLLGALRQIGSSNAFSRGGILEHASGTSEEPWESGESRWLKLPDRAAYTAWSPNPKWARVEFDDSARELFDRIKENSPRDLAGGRELQVWLAWDTGDPSAAAPRLAVHVGVERVGRLSAGVEKQFYPAMEAAAERDENPWMRGRLSTISGAMPYLLEIELPALSGG